MKRTKQLESSVKEWEDVFVFRVGKKRWAGSTALVEKILRINELTPVPLTPEFLLGIAYSGGGVLPVVQPHEILGEPCEVANWKGYDAVVLSYNGARMAITVEATEDIFKLSGNIEESDRSFSAGFVQIANKKVFLLDFSAFFSEVASRIKPATADSHS